MRTAAEQRSGDAPADEQGGVPTVPRPALTVSGLTKHYGSMHAVDGVDLVLAQGEFVTLLGPSGCGKSTLLRIVAGIDTATSGTIHIGDRLVSAPAKGVLVPPEKRQLGMVFQSYAVWPHMTVAKNVAFPLRYEDIPKRERNDIIESTLEAVHLGGLGHRYPSELSGGQQQRVALARAIVARPKLLLLDEPLSNLDARLREAMRTELKRLHIETGLTMLYVTHDQSEALAMSDRLLVMERGVVLQEGDPESVYANPASVAVADFLGVKNLLPGIVVDGGQVRIGSWNLRGVVLRDEGLVAGSKVTVAIRPDGFVRGSDGADDVSGTIDNVAFLGIGFDHQLDVGEGQHVFAYFPERLGVRHDGVSLQLKPGAATAYRRTEP